MKTFEIDANFILWTSEGRDVNDVNHVRTSYQNTQTSYIMGQGRICRVL